jgi:hypothetical protein
VLLQSLDDLVRVDLWTRDLDGELCVLQRWLVGILKCLQRVLAVLLQTIGDQLLRVLQWDDARHQPDLNRRRL